jgi:hypothetical protein
VLVADAAGGRRAFDAAFRREIKRVLPKAKLDVIPLDSPLFKAPFKMRTADYSDAVKAAEPQLNTPVVMGITIDGSLAVMYTPYSLGNGWERIGFPYNLGYADADALRLGVNILAYAVTH